MDNNITKNLIAKTLFYETGIPISILENFLDNLFKQIIINTKNDGLTKISNFGSFYIKNKKPRVGRNLNTLEEVVISARNVISFQPSEYLKQAINDKI